MHILVLFWIACGQDSFDLYAFVCGLQELMPSLKWMKTSRVLAKSEKMNDKKMLTKFK